MILILGDGIVTINMAVATVIGALGGALLLLFVIFPVMENYRDNRVEIYAPENLEELIEWSEKDLYKLSQNLKCSTVSYTTIVPHRTNQEQAAADFEELKRVCNIVITLWMEKYNLEQYNKATEGMKYLHKPRGDK